MYYHMVRYTYIYIYIYLYTQTNTFLHVMMNTSSAIPNVYIYIYTYIFTYIYIYVYMYIIYIYIYQSVLTVTPSIVTASSGPCKVRIPYNSTYTGPPKFRSPPQSIQRSETTFEQISSTVTCVGDFVLS